MANMLHSFRYCGTFDADRYVPLQVGTPRCRRYTKGDRRMAQGESNVAESEGHLYPELSILCDRVPMARVAAATLSILGMRSCPTAPLKLVLDAPPSYALHALEVWPKTSSLYNSLWSLARSLHKRLWQAGLFGCTSRGAGRGRLTDDSGDVERVRGAHGGPLGPAA